MALTQNRRMLNRQGAKKYKIFATADFTSGFHQTQLAETCRKYSAFIISMGVYEFTRVPFGLKTAPIYFQEKMASDVLSGLLYFICFLKWLSSILTNTTPKKKLPIFWRVGTSR